MTFLLFESPFNKGNFKAIFLAGGPGSGKNYVSKQILSGFGLREIDPDVAFEVYLKRERLSMLMPDDESPRRDALRDYTKTLTQKQRDLATHARQGIILNSTGANFSKIASQKHDLEQLGYDCFMVYVATTDEVSKQRNIERGQRGGRTVPEEIRSAIWQRVSENAKPFKRLFGDNFIELDNSRGITGATSAIWMPVWKKMRAFIMQAPRSHAASQWISQHAGVLMSRTPYKTLSQYVQESKLIAEEPDANANVDKVKRQQEIEKENLLKRQAQEMADAKIADMKQKFDDDARKREEAERRKKAGLPPAPKPLNTK